MGNKSTSEKKFQRVVNKDFGFRIHLDKYVVLKTSKSEDWEHGKDNTL
jgi:hypothetical protein